MCFVFFKLEEFQDGNHSALNQVPGASQSRAVHDYKDPSPARWDKVLGWLKRSLGLFHCYSIVANSIYQSAFAIYKEFSKGEIEDFLSFPSLYDTPELP